MKKVFLTISMLLVFAGLGTTTFAQRHDRGNHEHQKVEQRRDNREWQRRDEHRPRIVIRNYDTRDRYFGAYTVKEYRYIRLGGQVYKETYRTTYTRSGIVVDRVLVDRERISYDSRNRNKFRFNVFLRF